MKIRILLGKRIRELRLAKNLKQAELAEMIGVEPRSISRIESGFHFPKSEHLGAFSKALGVEIKDLFILSHLDDSDYVKKINELLSDTSEEKLRLIYKIAEAIIR